MMTDLDLSRRALLGAALSASLGRSASPNGRINLGIIGVGGRGSDHLRELQSLKDLNIAVTAICDVWRPNRERAVQAMEKAFGAVPRQTVDYQEMLSWPDVDAVIISSPDFTHSRMLQHAVQASKDVYCEKPFAVDFAEGKAAYLAVKKSGKVVQIGTQRRSEGPVMGAAKLVQSGALGQVTRIEFNNNFQEPRWARDYSMVKEADLAWKQFLMHGPARPFDARRFRQWQLFRDYTNGIAGLWMCHFIDLVPWFLNDPYPASAVASGGVYLWKDGRETSDVFHALLEYPKGFQVSFAMSLTNGAGDRNVWFGTKGTLDINTLRFSGDGSKQPDRVKGEIRVEPEPTTSHMRNFLECVRSRQTPRADIEAGFCHGVAVCMAAEALHSGRRMKFDPNRLEIVQG
jgi:predicted dehydrogenase